MSAGEAGLFLVLAHRPPKKVSGPVALQHATGDDARSWGQFYLPLQMRRPKSVESQPIS